LTNYLHVNDETGIQANNLSDMVLKLNDLKSVFKYGEKLIQIIQSIVEFMGDTVPLLENINNSISESTQKIPKASKQIQKVTNATEAATTEILDTVDEISNDLNFAADKITLLQQKNNFPEYSELAEIINSLNDKVYRITMSLQVQDITAQQLATVNHLIDSVQNKLTGILSDFESANTGEGAVQNEVPAATSFDPNASYSNKQFEQEQANLLVNNHFSSQDEIDKLFGN
jgi:chemotaxis regulatin CheY-phosphate phosphatase CheZ